MLIDKEPSVTVDCWKIFIYVQMEIANCCEHRFITSYRMSPVICRSDECTNRISRWWIPVGSQYVVAHIDIARVGENFYKSVDIVEVWPTLISSTTFKKYTFHKL